MNEFMNGVRAARTRVIVLVLVVFCYAIALVLPRATFADLIEEDGLFEYLTAFFFLITALVFFLLYLHPKYLAPVRLRSRYTTKGRRYVFLLFALLFFFGFGEEISWGQRIFGFSTPEILADNNIRNEFTIHNLEVFSAHEADGENKGMLKKLFTMKQMFLYTFFIYLFVIPVLNKRFSRFEKLLQRFFIPVPPIWLGFLFIGNYILYRGIRMYSDLNLESIMNSYITEMQEFNFSLILLLLPFSWFSLSKERTA